GTSAPLDKAHPHHIARDGEDHVNHGQRILWVSRDITKDTEAYVALEAALTSICEYLADRLQLYRPKLCEQLECYIDVLPRNAACPWAPFGGIVVNFNACSDAHRDGLDLLKRCFIIPVMRNCEGGGVVLYEARLVLDMHSGHGLLFPSGWFTHFNLHYRGVRASLVFHTDGQSKKWIPGKGGQGGNGWIGQNGVRMEGQA
ncbi:hypothetical protein B0H17DRAFT_948758, partial [Mycena rosella]